MTDDETRLQAALDTANQRIFELEGEVERLRGELAQRPRITLLPRQVRPEIVLEES